MRPVKSPHVRTWKNMSVDRFESGRKMAEAAQTWMESNEATFRAVVGFLKGLQRDGRRGRVRDRVAIFCIDNGLRIGGGSQAFTNATWAGIERYIALAEPGLQEMLSMTDSDIDCYGLLPVSWMPETEGTE